MKFVQIEHPDIEGSATVADRAWPHYKDKGWELADEQPPTAPVEDGDVPRPQKNDSTASWREYAVSQGMAEAAVAEMSRDQLVHHFTPADPATALTEEN